VNGTYKIISDNRLKIFKKGKTRFNGFIKRD
jgi:hypothetical protein